MSSSIAFSKMFSVLYLNGCAEHCGKSIHHVVFAKSILTEAAKHTLWTFEALVHLVSLQYSSFGVSYMKSKQINLEFLSRTKTLKIEKKEILYYFK